jgi:hypothetical protein
VGAEINKPNCRSGQSWTIMWAYDGSRNLFLCRWTCTNNKGKILRGNHIGKCFYWKYDERAKVRVMNVNYVSLVLEVGEKTYTPTTCMSENGWTKINLFLTIIKLYAEKLKYWESWDIPQTTKLNSKVRGSIMLEILELELKFSRIIRKQLRRRFLVWCK